MVGKRADKTSMLKNGVMDCDGCNGTIDGSEVRTEPTSGSGLSLGSRSCMRIFDDLACV